MSNVMDKLEAEAGALVADVIRGNKGHEIEFGHGLDLLAILGRLRDLRSALGVIMEEVHNEAYSETDKKPV